MRSKAFTLIELLVVIAIVGLLTAIAIVSYSTTRDKAKIASGLSFEQSLHNSLGNALAVGYDFDEGSGSVIIDSGGSNNATIVGSPTWSTDTFGSGSKYSMNFTGTDHIVPSGGLGLAATNFTIALWIKTTSANGQMYVVANAPGGTGYRFGLTSGRIAFLFGNAGGYVENICGSQSTNDGKWHHIAGVFSISDKLFSCFVDGRADGTVTLASTSYSGGSDVAPWIGKGMCCSDFVGRLDNVRIYAQNLSGVSINSLYNEEKDRFALADAQL